MPGFLRNGQSLFLKDNWEGLLFALGGFMMAFNPLVGAIILGIVGIIEVIKHWGRYNQLTEWNLRHGLIKV